jgi:DNA ligase-1
VIRFARLFERIDRTTSTNLKVEAMAEYFAAAPPADAAWAVFFLTGRRLKRLISGLAIRDWTLAATGFEPWMLEECYAVVGDGAETAALMFDAGRAGLKTGPYVRGERNGPEYVSEDGARPGDHVNSPARSGPSFDRPEDHVNSPARSGRSFDRPEDVALSTWVEDRILPLKQLDLATQQARVTNWLLELDRWQRFILLKLLSGELRLGVSQTLVVRALAQSADLPTTTIAARLMGDWQPTAEWFASLMAHGETTEDRSRPYPFYLASPFEDDVASLGDLPLWQVEWKWDGIRAQLVKRAGSVHLWSRGEELITHRFPEIAAAATHLPDGTVLDGEVLAFRDNRPLPFSALQQRIGRQKQVAQMVRAVPVVFMTYDVLELEARDVRHEPLSWRRPVLEQLLADMSSLRVSPHVIAASWEELAELRRESRARGVEGFMLKRVESPYGVGRKRGDWWKWKIDPYTVDAVLIYAQPGSGKRASLLTDYTFGLWDNGELVPIAKAYSGLSNDEIAELDKWIRRHTRERYGPVRHVEPLQVFELGFEAIAPSSRHKSGVAVRFPRMLRWRKDKPASEADTLDALKQLLEP